MKEDPGVWTTSLNASHLWMLTDLEATTSVIAGSRCPGDTDRHTSGARAI